jgi:hypothetical protein
MDLVTLASRIDAIEPAISDSVGSENKDLISQLDVIAEHLVGQTAHESQRLKLEVQSLIRRVSPERAAVGTYVEAYCAVSGTAAGMDPKRA